MCLTSNVNNHNTNVVQVYLDETLKICSGLPFVLHIKTKNMVRKTAD